MTMQTLLAVLAFGTMGVVVLLGWRSAVETERRRVEGKRKSTLAADAPNRTPKGAKPVDT
jgi:hypothetical protein